MTGKPGTYGKVREPLLDWVQKQEPGTEFWYGTPAEQLNLQKPSVSSVMLSWMRRGVLVAPGHAAGWYVVLAPHERNPAVLQNSHDLRVAGARGSIAQLLAIQSEPEPERNMDADPEMAEVVGKMKDGALLLKGDNGKLYRAEEM